jgi:CBS domain-containing protein
MPREMLVREVMTTDVVTFAPDETVEVATRRLLERDVDGAPVVDVDGRVIGMLGSDDLLVQETQLHYPTVFSLFGAYLELPSSHRRFEAELRRAVAAVVSDVMTRDPVTCAPDDTLERAATLMHEHRVSRLPVLDGDRLAGIVARGDLLRALIAVPGP